MPDKHVTNPKLLSIVVMSAHSVHGWMQLGSPGIAVILAGGTDSPDARE